MNFVFDWDENKANINLAKQSVLMREKQYSTTLSLLLFQTKLIQIKKNVLSA